MPTALVWFRNDLRLDDNPALRAALERGYTPIAVYVHAPGESGPWRPGQASNAWRHRSLQALDDDLHRRGSRLRRFLGPSLATLQALVAATEAEAVFWNRCYEPAFEARDARIKRTLRAQGVHAESFNGNLLLEPAALKTKQGTPFKVFTPFWRTAVAGLQLPSDWDAPPSMSDCPNGPAGVPLEALRLSPTLDWDSEFWSRWQPGEAGARLGLEVFVDGALRGYQQQRDRPDRTGTSRLSPHLHFGEIAPWRIVRELESERSAATAGDIDTAIKELGWREFAHYLLHHFPQTSECNFNPRFNDFDWARVAPDALAAWQQGQTGVPIVDAGMRELWRTGWMHNRVRMIVGSYLTKHMRYHWQYGARWFWDTLVDADLASNSMGWQWIAGTGADAAPYFRVFNPVTQAEKFDPAGAYIAHWVPEIAALPLPLRFAPWRDPTALKRVAPDYPPQPLVNLAEGRDAALAAFRGRTGASAA